MIREYQTADLEDIVAIWAAASALAHPFLTSEFLATERGNLANIYLPNAETWVWAIQGRAVGFISLLGNEVGGLFLDPTFHDNGIGRALLEHARSLRGELEVEVFHANSIGRNFYDKCGFALIEEKVHPETGQNLLRLRLRAPDVRVPSSKSPG